MKKLISLCFLLLPIFLVTTSCSDDHLNMYERDIVGEYVADDGSCFVGFYDDHYGIWEYRDSFSFDFDWSAKAHSIHLRASTGESAWYEYSMTNGGNLIIYNFDEAGDLLLLRSSHRYW